LKVLKPAGDIVVWAGIGVNLRIGGGTKAAGTGTGGRIRDRGRDRDRGGDGDRGGDRGGIATIKCRFQAQNSLTKVSATNRLPAVERTSKST